MNTTLLTAYIQFFLYNQEGLTEEQITEIRLDPKLELEIIPLIEATASHLKTHGHALDTIEQNKNMLIGRLRNA